MWNSSDSGPNKIRSHGLDFEQYLETVRGWVLFSGIHAHEVRASDDIPVAEWIRFGGANSLRGFSEGGLLAPGVAWGNFEVRRLLGRNSRVFLLFDLATYEIEKESKWKNSFGAGLQLDTGIGIINLAIAIPDSEGFTAAVVHMKAVARF